MFTVRRQDWPDEASFQAARQIEHALLEALDEIKYLQDLVIPNKTDTIINGDFSLWQRGTSKTSAGYLADRWKNDKTGSTFTASRQSFTLGQTDVPSNPQYFHRLTVTSSAGAGNYALVAYSIEGVETHSSEEITISFYAKADATRSVAVELAQIFGTGGSPSSTVTGIGVNTIELTTDWRRYSVTVTVPSISGKTLGSANDDYLRINWWCDAGSSFNSRTNSLGQQSITFDLANVQIDKGSIALPWRPRDKATELERAQRYYEKSWYLTVDPGTVTTDGMVHYNTDSDGADSSVMWVPFLTRKRAEPSVTVYDPTTGNSGGLETESSNDVSVSTNANQTGFRPAKGAAFSVRFMRCQFEADAEL